MTVKTIRIDDVTYDLLPKGSVYPGDQLLFENLRTELDARDARIKELGKDLEIVRKLYQDLYNTEENVRSKWHDAEMQVERLLASNTRLTKERDEARQDCTEQARATEAVCKERDEALARAAAWEKARDCERETVKRLEKELRISEDTNNSFCERDAWLVAKVERLRKELKRIRKMKDLR